MELLSVSENKGFVPGTTYKFSPPVKTNCISVGGQGGWTQKSFSEGWCLRFEGGKGAFQGKPLGEKGTYFFHVIHGGGSRATEVNKISRR